MHKAHVSKNSQWQMNVFGGLAFNELLAKEIIGAHVMYRSNPQIIENILKGIRKIHNH